MKSIINSRREHPHSLGFRRPVLLLSVLLLSVSPLSGCGGGAARSAGVEYTLTGVAYRTVSADLTAAKRAAVKALKQLDMNPTGAVNTDRGAKVLAATASLNIKVEMERVTSRVTKIFVDAKGRVLRDKATGAEILRRMLENLGIRN
jgi:hypothetical protein